jgi:hypothetical protein
MPAADNYEYDDLLRREKRGKVAKLLKERS